MAPVAKRVRAEIELVCADCGEDFTTRSRTKERCTDCGAARKREYDREYASERREPSYRTVTLTLGCGHLTELPMKPIEGEWLWCGRCADWLEYTPYPRRLCDAGQHKMTKFNTHKNGSEALCRKCHHARTGEFL